MHPFGVLFSLLGGLLLEASCGTLKSLPIADKWFSTEKLDPPSGCGYELYRTREIHETSQNAGVNGNYYLLKSRSTDLLVDTGTGVASLHSHLEELDLIGGGRPLVVLATHEHFDHAGGLKEFQNATILMGEADADSVVKGNGFRTDAVLIKTLYALEPRTFWDAAPNADFRTSLLNYEVKSRVDLRVKYFDTIFLGDGVSFAVVELPGHTPGSIGLFNVNGTGELYAGDAIYDARLYDFLPDSNKRAYRATMELLDQLNVSVAYPGHEEVLSRHRYQQLIDCYIAGTNPCTTPPMAMIV